MLLELPKYVPHVPAEVIGPLGKLLAQRLNPRGTPIDFVMVCLLATKDMEWGIEIFTGLPVEGTGYPSETYALLRSEIPAIAAALFHTEFAEEVKKFMEQK